LIVIIPLIVVIGLLAWVLRPGKKPAASRRIAIIVSTLPGLGLALSAIVVQLLHNANGTMEVSDISNTLFVAGLCLTAAWILAVIGFIIARKGEIAMGIGFGTCIAVFISVIELCLLEWLGGV